MTNTLSTTKEKEVIWEENVLTEPMIKSESNGELDGCDTTINTRKSNENDHLKDIIRKEKLRIQSYKKYHRRKTNPYYIEKWKARKVKFRRIHYFRHLATCLREKYKV